MIKKQCEVQFANEKVKEAFGLGVFVAFFIFSIIILFWEGIEKWLGKLRMYR